MDLSRIQDLVAFTLVGLAFLAFFSLDGFDLGASMLLPFFSRKDSERKSLLDAIWPFWDGNELWAVIGGALLLAGFPAVFVGVMGGLSPFVAGLLVFLMLRAVAFEAWYKDSGRRPLWEIILALASLLLAFAFGFAGGALMRGLPIDSGGAWHGGILPAFGPLPLATGLLAVAAALLDGCLWLAMRLDAAAKERARALSRRVFPFAAAAGAIVLAWAGILASAWTKPLFIVTAAGAGLAIAACGYLIYGAATSAGKGKAAFRASLASIALFGLAWAAALHPWLVRPGAGSPGLTIAQAANAPSTMRFLSIAGVPAFLAACLFSIILYRTFKGRPAIAEHETTETDRNKGATTMNGYVRCKACGYIMEAGKLGGACPACGVPATQFEPWDDRLSAKRRFLLELHIHPVIVHLPQAIAVLLLLFCAALFLPLGGLAAKLADATEILAVILPFSTIAAIASGIYDGILRFRSVKPLHLKRKLALGAAFLVFSSCGAVLVLTAGIGSAFTLALLLVLSAASLGAGAFLGIIGSRLGIARFPG